MNAGTKAQATTVAVIRFVYCGRGDTIFVWAEGGGWGLIDCNLSRSSGAEQRVRKLIQDNDIRDLAFICLTHPDLDHYRGMRDLLAKCFCDPDLARPRFAQFWDSGADLPLLEALAQRSKRKLMAEELTAFYDFLQPFVEHDSIERVPIHASSSAVTQFGDFDFVALAPRYNRVARFNLRKAEDILGAPDDQLRGPREESNDISCILVLMHRQHPLNIVFGGDATAKVWEEALAAWERILNDSYAGRNGRFAGVKVSHHGAKGSLHHGLYDKYCRRNRTIAVLSVGHADPDHPHPDVLRVLKDHGIRVYATCWPAENQKRIRRDLLLAGSPVEANQSFYPLLPGHRCSDVEMTVWSNGHVSARPRQSGLRLP